MTAWLLAGLTAAMLCAQPQNAVEGQKRYDAGDYAGAATVFSQATAQEPRQPAWHYNLGNALYKAGRLGPAIASYQRAFDLAPRDADVRYNLSFALKRAGEELVPPGVPAPFFSLFHLASLAELGGLHWLACWIALALASAWVLRPGRRDSLQGPATLALAAWAALGLWWGARIAAQPEALGVIIMPTAEVRSGPGASFNVSFTIPEGRRVEILSEAGPWIEVGLPKEGAKGWLNADSIERI